MSIDKFTQITYDISYKNKSALSLTWDKIDLVLGNRKDWYYSGILLFDTNHKKDLWKLLYV